MIDDDPVARNLIAKALGNVVDEAVREHISSITQEPALTARIGQALEVALNNQTILGHQIHIMTQDVPDRGPGALESDLGADLYAGIEVRKGDKYKTKGFLVQAKLPKGIKGAAGRQELKLDCENMLARNSASYVWIYGESGVKVLNAKQIVDDDDLKLRDMPTRRAATLFARTLECKEGSPALGLPAGQDRRARLGVMLQEFRLKRGVAVYIER